MVGADASRVASHLVFLPRHRAAHVRASRGREESRVAEVVDSLLPLVARFLARVDVFDFLVVGELDGITDPAVLDLDAGRTIGEERRSMRPVQVEHVGIAGDGGAEIGVCAFFPLVLKEGSVDVT